MMDWKYLRKVILSKFQCSKVKKCKKNKYITDRQDTHSLWGCNVKGAGDSPTVYFKGVRWGFWHSQMVKVTSLRYLILSKNRLNSFWPSFPASWSQLSFRWFEMWSNTVFQACLIHYFKKTCQRFYPLRSLLGLSRKFLSTKQYPCAFAVLICVLQNSNTVFSERFFNPCTITC